MYPQSLDKKSEQFIVEQIKEVKGKNTIILISHNLDTIRDYDKVFEIKNKKINLYKSY